MPLTLTRPVTAAAIAKLASASGLAKSQVASIANAAAAAAATAAPPSKTRLRARARTQTAERILAILAPIYPHLFGSRPRPLAVGIYDAIVARHPEIDPRDLQTFLSVWTKSRRYALALRFNKHRVDLDNNVAGEVQAFFQGMKTDEILKYQAQGIAG
jgi:hypothetical protein